MEATTQHPQMLELQQRLHGTAGPLRVDHTCADQPLCPFVSLLPFAKVAMVPTGCVLSAFRFVDERRGGRSIMLNRKAGGDPPPNPTIDKPAWMCFCMSWRT